MERHAGVMSILFFFVLGLLLFTLEQMAVSRRAFIVVPRVRRRVHGDFSFTESFLDPGLEARGEAIP